MSLKELTSEKHKQAERMPFNVRMFKGELSKEEYLDYLIAQASIFQIFEQMGVPHPSLLRLQRIFEDIEELGVSSIGGTDIKSIREYGLYLQKLTYEEMLPHMYLHYLALMYGGQMMKSKVPGSGRMYDFDDMQGAAGSIRSLQKDEWADEVNKGFDFMINIFDELEGIHNPAK
jgi:heme oxygenase